jgi:hypothetical protein
MSTNRRIATSGIILLSILLLVTACSNSSSGAAPGATPQSSQSATSVSQRYQALSKTLQGEIDTFAQANTQAGSGQTTTKPVMGAHLLIANGNIGPGLLDPAVLDAAKLNLNRFQELGIQGVTITISFPLLTPNFPQSTQYLTFYQKVAHEIRARHMTLTIEQNMIFTGTTYSPVKFDYSQYTFAQFIAADHQMAQTILDKIAPDYLAVLGEPDTYAKLTGFKELQTVQGATDFARGVMQGLQKGKTLVGAGTGSWLGSQYAQSLITLPGLDFLDIHIYEIDPQFIQNAFTMANIAHQAKKRVIMDEAWLYKTTKAELQSTGRGIATNDVIFQRDHYSFWEPLDSAFLAQIVRFTRVEGLDYVSPFWTTNFFAYLQYSSARESQSYKEQAKELNQLAYQNMQQDTFSSVGLAYRDAIRASTSQ